MRTVLKLSAPIRGGKPHFINHLIDMHGPKEVLVTYPHCKKSPIDLPNLTVIVVVVEEVAQ